MSTLGEFFDDGDWSMGGAADPEAAACMGFSEAEVTQAAVYAYQAVTEPGIVASREKRLAVFFDAFRDGVLSYLDD
ncbi:hypothetical protein ASD68_03545 [Rhodanobacter sp. Root627]|uniref:hypothetical protein n=1 Tax=Rhodanobacter sp. Root627 TaxID=1736572 RepID=UPI0006FF8DE1|nr:hypothetical protein [Rhodanobacter sp. Root627]KRA35488.1 hypothetical protein ASD68_03545 [Rhodanobacter sp. Root627]